VNGEKRLPARDKGKGRAATHARRFRLRSPCESMSSSRPMMTMTVCVTLTSVPGTNWWILDSREV